MSICRRTGKPTATQRQGYILGPSRRSHGSVQRGADRILCRDLPTRWLRRAPTPIRPGEVAHLGGHVCPAVRGAPRVGGASEESRRRSVLRDAPIRGPMGRSRHLENDDVMAVVSELVGPDFVMCQFATDTPVLDSGYQEVHRDTPALF